MTQSSDNAGLRQLRRRGGGWFVEHQKERDLNELKARIIAYEEALDCQSTRNQLAAIRLHCVRFYSAEEVQIATIEAYTSIRL